MVKRKPLIKREKYNNQNTYVSEDLSEHLFV